MIPHQIHGLPVHPLAVHGAVVLVPLATLLAILFVIPRTRNWAALAMPIVSVGALVAVWVARETGFNFKNHLVALSGGQVQFNNSVLGKAIDNHESKANVLFYMMIGFAIIAVVVYVLWRRPGKFTGAVEYAACTVLVVAALVVAFQTYRVGEAGSKAVYNPDGSQNFSSSAVVSPRQF